MISDRICMMTWQWTAKMSRPWWMMTRWEMLMTVASRVYTVNTWLCYLDNDMLEYGSEEWWSKKRMSNNRTNWRDRWCWCDWWNDVTVSFNCKRKLVLLLRLGYLKPFLAGSKKNMQGPGWRVGALCISRCWFYLTVVAGPKLLQKYYKIIWCCVLVMASWFRCLWFINDEVIDAYEMIRQMVE